MGGLSLSERQSIIGNKINIAYILYGKMCTSKTDLNNKIQASLTENEKKYFEDKDIKEYFDSQLDLIWKRIEIDKNEIFNSINEDFIIKNIQNKYDEAFAKMLNDHQNEILSLQTKAKMEEEEKLKESKEKFEKMYNTFQEKIKKLEEDAENERKNMEKKQKEIEENFQKKIEMIKKQFQDERDEEQKNKLEKKQKKLEEQKKKIEDINNTFKKRVEIIKENKIEEIIDNFKKNEKSFCKKEISNFDNNEIKLLIKDILKSEKIPKFIKNNLNLKVNNMKNEINKIEHLNIILVGPTGVGKSTLIKAMLDLKLSDSEVEIGFGTPQNKDIKTYESINIPFLRLIDSQGIEKSINSGVYEIYEKIKNYINEQIDKRDYDKFIHCIWYCWTGSRLEECEIEILKKLSEQYSLEELPVIIVYTKAIDKEEIEQAKKYINDIGLNNTFIEVLAKEKKIIFDNNETKIKQPYNLDILRNKSIELAKNAVKSSIYQCLIEEINIDIKTKIDDLMVHLKENIKKEINNYLEKIDEMSDEEEDKFYEMNVKIIVNVLYKYFLLDPEANIKNTEKLEISIENFNFSFGQSNILKLKNFVIQYFTQCLNSFQNNIDKFIEENTNIIFDEIMTFKNEFNINNENLLQVGMTNMEHKILIKNEIKNKIYNIAKLTAFKNAFNYITNPLIDKIGEYFFALYEEGIKNKKFSEYANSIIKVSFDEIESKIKEYNEKLNKKSLNIQQINEEPAPQNEYFTPNKSVNNDAKELMDDDD